MRALGIGSVLFRILALYMVWFVLREFTTKTNWSLLGGVHWPGDPIDLMDYTSNMEIGLCWYKIRINNKSINYLTYHFGGRLRKNICTSFYDMYCRLRCL